MTEARSERFARLVPGRARLYRPRVGNELPRALGASRKPSTPFLGDGNDPARRRRLARRFVPSRGAGLSATARWNAGCPVLDPVLAWRGRGAGRVGAPTTRAGTVRRSAPRVPRSGAGHLGARRRRPATWRAWLLRLVGVRFWRGWRTGCSDSIRSRGTLLCPPILHSPPTNASECLTAPPILGIGSTGPVAIG